MTYHLCSRTQGLIFPFMDFLKAKEPFQICQIRELLFFLMEGSCYSRNNSAYKWIYSLSFCWILQTGSIVFFLFLALLHDFLWSDICVYSGIKKLMVLCELKQIHASGPGDSAKFFFENRKAATQITFKMNYISSSKC